MGRYLDGSPCRTSSIDDDRRLLSLSLLRVVIEGAGDVQLTAPIADRTLSFFWGTRT